MASEAFCARCGHPATMHTERNGCSASMIGGKCPCTKPEMTSWAEREEVAQWVESFVAAIITGDVAGQRLMVQTLGGSQPHRWFNIALGILASHCAQMVRFAVEGDEEIAVEDETEARVNMWSTLVEHWREERAKYR